MVSNVSIRRQVFKFGPIIARKLAGEIALPPQSIIAIKKSGLAAYRISSRPFVTTESETTRIGEVLLYRFRS